jgi:purine-binding chemotaxis protein CheW
MQERFLLFSAAGDRFALNLQEVAEVMEPQQAFPVPRTPRHFTGLINFHGTLTTLIDLGLYLGGERRSTAGKVLVLELKGAHFALKVDAVRSIVPRDAIVAESPGEDALTAAVLETGEGRFRLLHSESLLFALEQDL